jgi:hypothetical protein
MSGHLQRRSVSSGFSVRLASTENATTLFSGSYVIYIHYNCAGGMPRQRGPYMADIIRENADGNVGNLYTN